MTEQPDSGTLREQIARTIGDYSYVQDPHGNWRSFTVEVLVDAVMTVVGPLVERLHQAEGERETERILLADAMAAGHNLTFPELINYAADATRMTSGLIKDGRDIRAERDQLRAELAEASASARDSAAYAEQGWTEVERLRAELAEAQKQRDRYLEGAEYERERADAEARATTNLRDDLSQERRQREADRIKLAETLDAGHDKTMATLLHWVGELHRDWQRVLVDRAQLWNDRQRLLWLHAEAAWQRDRSDAALESAQRQMTRFETQCDAWKAALGVYQGDIDTTPNQAVAALHASWRGGTAEKGPQ